MYHTVRSDYLNPGYQVTCSCGYGVKADDMESAAMTAIRHKEQPDETPSPKVSTEEVIDYRDDVRIVVRKVAGRVVYAEAKYEGRTMALFVGKNSVVDATIFVRGWFAALSHADKPQ